MAGEAEIAAGAVLAGMRTTAHVFSDFAKIAVEDHGAVQLHSNRGTDYRHLLVVPLIPGEYPVKHPGRRVERWRGAVRCAGGIVSAGGSSGCA